MLLMPHNRAPMLRILQYYVVHVFVVWAMNKEKSSGLVCANSGGLPKCNGHTF